MEGGHTLATKQEREGLKLLFSWFVSNIFCLTLLSRTTYRIGGGSVFISSLYDACRIQSQSFNTIRIILKFFVGLRYSLLYFLIQPKTKLSVLKYLYFGGAVSSFGKILLCSNAFAKSRIVILFYQT